MNILQIDKIFKILQTENVLKLDRTEAHIVSRIKAWHEGKVFGKGRWNKQKRLRSHYVVINAIKKGEKSLDGAP